LKVRWLPVKVDLGGVKMLRECQLLDLIAHWPRTHMEKNPIKTGTEEEQSA
jgi:hypothetical protein